MALGVSSGFTRGEYHVVRGDFIVALRRTRGQRRWTLRSPSSIRSTLAWFRGEGGIRKSRRPCPLVPPQGAIKSTRAMRYSSLRKTKQAIKAKRRFRIKKPTIQAHRRFRIKTRSISQTPVKAENARGQSGQVPIIAVPQAQQKPSGSVLRTCRAGIYADCRSK